MAPLPSLGKCFTSYQWRLVSGTFSGKTQNGYVIEWGCEGQLQKFCKDFEYLRHKQLALIFTTIAVFEIQAI